MDSQGQPERRLHAVPAAPRIPAFSLRLPDDVMRHVRVAARENGRSINSEITQRLRRSFQGYQR